MIRAATQADIPSILDLGELLHAQSSYAKLSFERKKVADLMSSIIRGAGVVYVAERPEVGLVGGLAGGTTEFWFGHDVHGFDYSFFVHPEHRHGVTAFRLLLAFEEWCKRRGASEIRVGITTGINQAETTRFYEWAGYQQNGVLFTKEIK